MRRATGLTAIAVLALVILAEPTWAQRPPPELPTYGHTLMQGSGYITTPHGLVSKSSLFITGSIIAPEGYMPAAGDPRDSYSVARISAGLTLAQFLEIGGYFGGVDPGGPGLFGKIQIIRQTGIWPAIALGVQNLTTFDNGRYGIEDRFYNDIQEATTLYGVFTYVVGPGRTSFPSWVTISAGWGTGLFFEDNPQIEEKTRTSGVFGALSLDFQAGEGAYIRVMGEWDGYDLNFGALANLSGLELSMGFLSVGRGDAPEGQDPTDPFNPELTFAGQYYNQMKPYVSLTVDLRALGAIPWIVTTDEE
jgi:hypothetical protein